MMDEWMGIDLFWSFEVCGHVFFSVLLTVFGIFEFTVIHFLCFCWLHLGVLGFSVKYLSNFFDHIWDFLIFSQHILSFLLTYLKIWGFSVNLYPHFHWPILIFFNMQSSQASIWPFLPYLAISSTRITILFLQLTPKYPNSLSSIWFYNHPPLHTIPVWRKHHYFLTFPSRTPRHFTHSQSDVSPLFSKRAHWGVQRGGGLATPSRPFAYF